MPMATKDEIKQAILEAQQEDRANRRRRRAVLGAVEMVITTSGVLGLFAGFLPSVLTGSFGIALGVFDLIAVGVMTFALVRSGRSILASLLFSVGLSALVIALIFGIFWYFMSYLPQTGQPLFNFGK